MMREVTLGAPVLVSTLCRAEHFERCLESLAANTWAFRTPVYVALDYPAKESHRPGYERICAYLDAFDGECFGEFHVIKRERNFGSGVNGALAREMLFERYGRLIYSEDDLEYAPAFLEYMNAALDRYEDDPRVDTICGYSYPLPWRVREGANAFFCDSAYPSWGYGTWDTKRRLSEGLIKSGWLVDEFDRAFHDGTLDRMVSNARCEYLAYAGLEMDPSIPRTPYDFVCRMYLALSGTCVVCPTVSLVRNHGFDGSGEYCASIAEASGAHSQDYNYAAQELFAGDAFHLDVDERMSSGTENGRLLDEFLYTPRFLKVEASIASVLYRLFGHAGLRFGCGAYHAVRRIVRGK